MKTITKIILPLVLLSGLLLVAAAPLQEPDTGRIVLGGTYVLQEDETLEGDLFIMGGVATLEENSVVDGGVVIMGGTMVANGLIKGDINVVGGFVNLGETAVVEGDVNAIGGHVERDEGARVEGTINTGLTMPFPLELTGRIQAPRWTGPFPFIVPGDVRVPFMDISVNPLVAGLWVLFKSFLWAVVAMLVVLFLPENSRRAANAAVTQPIGSVGVGCLTTIVVPPILILLAITICGIPISMIGALLLAIAWAFGIIALGRETGERFTRMLNRDWAPAVSAGMGTFGLTLVINGVSELIPCVGWLLPALVGMIGLGAVLLTRFGSQAYVSYSAPMSSSQMVEPVLEQADSTEFSLEPGEEKTSDEKPEGKSE